MLINRPEEMCFVLFFFFSLEEQDYLVGWLVVGMMFITHFYFIIFFLYSQWGLTENFSVLPAWLTNI